MRPSIHCVSGCIVILQEYGTAAGIVTFLVEGISNVANLFVDARGGDPVYGQGGGAQYTDLLDLRTVPCLDL